MATIVAKACEYRKIESLQKIVDALDNEQLVKVTTRLNGETSRSLIWFIIALSRDIGEDEFYSCRIDRPGLVRDMVRVLGNYEEDAIRPFVEAAEEQMFLDSAVKKIKELTELFEHDFVAQTQRKYKGQHLGDVIASLIGINGKQDADDAKRTLAKIEENYRPEAVPFVMQVMKSVAGSSSRYCKVDKVINSLDGDTVIELSRRYDYPLPETDSVGDIVRCVQELTYAIGSVVCQTRREDTVKRVADFAAGYKGDHATEMIDELYSLCLWVRKDDAIRDVLDMASGHEGELQIKILDVAGSIACPDGNEKLVSQFAKCAAKLGEDRLWKFIKDIKASNDLPYVIELYSGGK